MRTYARGVNSQKSLSQGDLKVPVLIGFIDGPEVWYVTLKQTMTRRVLSVLYLVAGNTELLRMAQTDRQTARVRAKTHKNLSTSNTSPELNS